MAFIIWCIIGGVFVIMGVCSFFSEKPVRFWANAKMFDVTDVKKYNSAVGRLWICFGAVFALLGIPLNKAQNSQWAIVSILGVVFEVIVLMVVYTTVIEKKYRKK